MDGHFVPNLTFGAPIIRAIRRLTDRPLDVHLMVERPEQYIAEYADAGANVFTFHPEATVHVQRQLAAVRERGMQADSPSIPARRSRSSEEVLDDLDLRARDVGEPGFRRQSYLPGSTDKIRRARALLDRHGRRRARGRRRHHRRHHRRSVGRRRRHLRRRHRGFGAPIRRRRCGPARGSAPSWSEGLMSKQWIFVGSSSPGVAARGDRHTRSGRGGARRQWATPRRISTPSISPPATRFRSTSATAAKSRWSTSGRHGAGLPHRDADDEAGLRCPGSARVHDRGGQHRRRRPEDVQEFASD